MHNAIAEKLNENPVIAAVAEPQRLPAALASAKQCGEQECRYENDPPFFHKKEYLRPSL